MKVDVLLYHEGCADGFCAAWIAACKLGSEQVSFRAIKPNEYDVGDLAEYRDKHVAIFDVLPSKKALSSLAFTAKRLTLRDHHTTNRSLCDEFAKLPNVDSLFDLQKSGAGLAWEFFFPGQPLPPIVAHIQDRDLWKFEIPGSGGVHDYLAYTVGFSFAGWTEAAALPYEQLLVRGSIAKLTAQTFVDMVSRIPDKMPLSPKGHILFVNAAILASDVGHTLLSNDKQAVFAVVWRQAGGKMRVSLRGADRTTVDLAVLAKMFGGGGHRNASGFASRHPSFLELSYAIKSAYETLLNPPPVSSVPLPLPVPSMTSQ